MKRGEHLHSPGGKWGSAPWSATAKHLHGPRRIVWAELELWSAMVNSSFVHINKLSPDIAGGARAWGTENLDVGAGNLMTRLGSKRMGPSCWVSGTKRLNGNGDKYERCILIRC